MNQPAEMPESEDTDGTAQVAYVRVLGVIGLDGHNIGAMLERRLLACLAANHRQPIRTDRLVDALWDGHPPRAAESSLMSKVTRLRSRLGEGRLVRTANGYHLKLTVTDYDAAHFEDLAVRALYGSGLDALHAARGAMALWRGDPFSEFSTDEFASAETARLSRLYEQTAERYAELLLELGDVAQALSQAERLLLSVPSSERLCSIQARSLSRLGRHADALTAINDFRVRLREDFGLSTTTVLRQVEQQLLDLTGDEDPVVVAPESRPSAVRWPTVPQENRPIVGRSNEVQNLLVSLVKHRLVTVTGEAGIGKSRVAAAVAKSMCSADAVDPPAAWLSGSAIVSLEAAWWALGGDRRTTGPDLATRTAEMLDGSATLLVIDGCEHADAVVLSPLIEWVLASTGLRVLATMREPLRVAAEHEVRLSPLDIDGSPSPAGQLLAQMCNERRLKVRPDESDDIARLLDGLPLALELVAARLADLPADVVASVLADPTARAELIGGSGDNRLTREVERSVGLLSNDARSMFVALSFFPNGATFPLVQSVLDRGGAGGSLAPLLHLLDRSLVRVESSEGGERRYRMLSPIADVGRMLAAKNDETSRYAEWFAEAIIEFAEGLASSDCGPSDGPNAAAISAEFDNIRAAYRACRRAGEHVQAGRLVAALHDEAILRERAEIEQWADELVVIERCVRSEWGAKILGIAATGALLQGEFERSMNLALQGADALRAGAQPTWLIANVRYMLGASHDLATTRSVTDQRQRHLDDLRRYTEQTGDPMGQAMASFSESFVHAAFGLREPAIPPAIALVRHARRSTSPTLMAIGNFTIANARSFANPARAIEQAGAASKLGRLSGCGVIERHAERLELDLLGATSPDELDLRLERAARNIRAAVETGHREHALQEIAGLVRPLFRLSRFEEVARIIGGLERTLWGQLRNVLDTRESLIATLGLPTYQKLSRPSRRLTWTQLADLACEVAGLP